MKKTYKLILTLSVSSLLFSCAEDPEPWFSLGNNGWEYYNGDGNIKEDKDVILDFDIDNNLNLDGTATITTGLSIGDNLNLNKGGKSIIDTYHEDDTIYIDGKININDSLLIFNGIVIVRDDININSTGVINVANSATLITRNDLNNSGSIYGMKNVTVDGVTNLNGGNVTKQEPLQLTHNN